MTAQCFPSGVAVTFDVPQGGNTSGSGGGGEGPRRATTDASGSATVRFTYHARNGLTDSNSYSLLVSTEPDAWLGGNCPPSDCASATFYER